MDQVVEKDVAWVASGFAALEARVQHGIERSLHPLRRQAYDQFRKLGLPTPKNEDWKYTNLQSLARSPLAPRLVSDVSSISTEEIAAAACVQSSAARLVFINGFYSSDHSEQPALPAGIRVRSIREVLNEAGTDAELLTSHLGSHASFEDDALVALNTAFIQDGVLVVAEKGAALQQPVLVQFVTTNDSAQGVCYPRVLILTRENAQLRVIEQFVGYCTEQYLTSSVTELVVEERAVVEHYRVQEEGSAATHISRVTVHQAQGATASTFVFSFGGKLSRNEVNPCLDGERSEARMFGLTVLNGEQHVDNHTVLDHAKPHCESTELYKGIYAGHSKGIFNGTIIVRQDAQKTNAIQSNQSILLSETAESNAKPQLKIWADDVKCTHGATVGQIDEDALFYMRSRGIGKELAKDIMIRAFAEDIISQVAIDELADYLEGKLLTKLTACR